jgi:hypothetical protein|tara:strand:- start:239 stop:424 length:186 start_codon:yes stop_codon:yes gene_type:complete
MYVDADGQYGSAWEMIQFEHGRLDEAQWDRIYELDGYDRLKYIKAILEEDHDMINEYEDPQ